MSVPTPALMKAQIEKKKPIEKVSAAEQTIPPESSTSVTKTVSDTSLSVAKKKTIVRPDHLTQRPFQDSEELRALKESMPLSRSEMALKRKKDRDMAVKTAKRMKDQGMSNIAIGKKLGIAESTVRSLVKNPENNKEKN